MSWFSKAFKSVTKAVEKAVRQTTKEIGRAASKVAPILSSIPLPIGGFAGGAVGAAGALLQGKSATKYIESIPTATLQGLLKGASILANPGEALNSALNTIGVAQEQFKSSIGVVPIKDLLAQAKTALSSPELQSAMSLAGQLIPIAGGVADGSLGLSPGGLGGIVGGAGSQGGLASLGGGSLVGSASGPAGLGQYGGGSGIGAGGSLATASGLPSGNPIGAAGWSTSRGVPVSVRVILNSAGQLAGASWRF